MPRTFIYKRTHEGDPDRSGRFGVFDCMGRLRGLKFDAVIGIGGIGAIAQNHAIAGKLNWIGIGPRKSSKPHLNGPLVRFDTFLYLGSEGPELRHEAPALAARMYAKNAPRFVFDVFSLQEQAGINRLLTRAKWKRTSGQSTVFTGREARPHCARSRMQGSPSRRSRGQ